MIYTITEPIRYEVKIQRSQFIAFLFPIDTVEQARELLSEHNKEYANATHNCYAYVLGSAQQVQYYSDAGEPSGTAGKPMLNAILRKNMTNVLAIVTRYYGGVKLGVKGLIEAYGHSVQEALDTAQPLVYQETITICGRCEYSFWDSLKYKVEEFGATIEASGYEQMISLKITVAVENAVDLQKMLDSYVSMNKLELDI